MKKSILIYISFFLNCATYAQNWQSSVSIGGNGSEGISVTCEDFNGNLYVTGSFTGTFCVLKTDTIWAPQSAPSYSFFAKFSPTGNLLWSVINSGNLSSTCSGGITKMVYDSISNTILFAGAYCNSTYFKDTVLILGSYYTQGIFGKMDVDGNLIWSRQITGTSWMQYINAIDYDTNDDIYICGTSTYVFKIDTTSYTPGIFLAKYSAQGTKLWAKKISGMANVTTPTVDIRDIKLTNSCFYIIGGAQCDSLNFDSIHFERTNSVGLLIAKFNLNGNILWAKIAGYPKSGSRGNGVISKDKSIYIVSTFYNSDSAIFDNQFITKSAAADVYIAKYDSNGVFKWVRQTNPIDRTEGYAISIDKNDILYITGKFRGTAQFGNYSIISTAGSPSPDNYDVFLAAYDTSGNCLGVDNFGYAQGFSVMLDKNNIPIVSGRYYNTVTIGNTSYTANGSPNAFIAKHDAITGIKYNTKSSNTQLFIHANPNEGKCNITIPDDFLHEQNLVLSIYNSNGKLIQQKNLEMNQNKIKINLEAQAKGLYNAVLSNGTKSYSGKIVFE